MRRMALRRLAVGFALTVGLGAFGDPAAAQRSEVPPSRETAFYSFAPVVKMAAPATRRAVVISSDGSGIASARTLR